MLSGAKGKPAISRRWKLRKWIPQSLQKKLTLLTFWLQPTDPDFRLLTSRTSKEPMCCFESLRWCCFVIAAMGKWYNCLFILPLLFYSDPTSILLLPSLNLHTISKWGISISSSINPERHVLGVGDLTLHCGDQKHLHTEGKKSGNNSVRTAVVV